MRKLKLYREFLGTPTKNYSYMEAKMQELSELVNDILKSDYGTGASFEYDLTESDLEVTLVLDHEHEIEDSITLEILFDLDSLMLGIYLGHGEDFHLNSIEEGLDMIEKKIYDVLGISEKKKN